MRNISVRGKKFSVSPCNRRLWDFFEKDRWEPHTLRILDRFLDKRHSFIDIGSWIGPTVLYGGCIARQVYAVEPDPATQGVLEENINLNPAMIERISLFKGCIGSTTGKVKMGSRSRRGDSMSSILFADSHDSWESDSLCFDDFARKFNVHDCSLIKIDIEGGESLVLPEMKKYLQENRPTLYLSLHPMWFKNPEKSSENIIGPIRHYKNIFNIFGEGIAPEALKQEIIVNEKPFEIIATDYENIYRESDTDGFIDLLKGIEAEKEKDYAKAISYFERAKRYDNARSLEAIADAYIKMKYYDKALHVYSSLIKIDSSSPLVMNNIANILVMKKEYSKAIIFLKKAVTKGHPDKEKILRNIRLFMRLNK